VQGAANGEIEVVHHEADGATAVQRFTPKDPDVVLKELQRRIGSVGFVV
jgi:hypothetical protein